MASEYFSLYPLTPETYTLLLTLWTFFPIVSIYQLFISDFYPMGKTTLPRSSKWSLLNIPGRIAWITMELPSPIWLVITAFTVSRMTGVGLWGEYEIGSTSGTGGAGTRYLGGQREWSDLWDKRKREVLVVLYVVHYLNRAIINPLLSPTSTPMHLLVYLLAHIFNIINPILIGGYLGGFSQTPISASSASSSSASSSSTSTSTPKAEFSARKISTASPPFLKLNSSTAQFLLGITIWLLGFVGNLYHERILREIRMVKEKEKKEEERKHEEEEEVGEKKEEANNDTSAHLALNALHTRLALISDADADSIDPPQNLGSDDENSKPIPAGSETGTTSTIHETKPKKPNSKENTTTNPWYFCEWIEWTGFAIAAGSNCTPAILFVVNEISTMLPRAMAGKRWYKKTFGAQLPADRKAAIPFLV
ncbi:hypothetical protein DFH27DRAFT_366024 [Peziza echinospora]|nr:hypothetical protein DFH27DRAFT_366024 [Peziza echinospora]